MIKIFHAQNEFAFKLLEQYLLPYEKYCCTLMQKILSHEKSIYFLGDMNIGDVLNISEAQNTSDTLHLTPSDFNKAHTSEINTPTLSDIQKPLSLIHGVIFFEKGRTVFHCLPEHNSEIFDALKFFFLNQAVSGIVGEKTGTLYLQSILQKAHCGKEVEVRDYYFMEASNIKLQKDNLVAESSNKIILCTQKDINSLMPLQLAYVNEEVTPKSRKTNDAAEGLMFEKLVKKNAVYGIKNNSEFISKAHISVSTNNYFQIGGVYTVEQFRNHGLACFLVKEIAKKAALENKKAVLFVNQKNISALHSYQKAGFVKTGEYRIVYY